MTFFQLARSVDEADLSLIDEGFDTGVNLHPDMTRKLHRKMYRQKRRKYTYSR